MTSSALRSMTGFGTARRESAIGRMTVEIKSVNSRFLEISTSLPRELAAFEYPLRNLLKESIERGKVDCRVRFEPSPELASQVRLNEPAILQYLQTISRLKHSLGDTEPPRVESVLGLPGVAMTAEDARDLETYWLELSETTRLALEAFHAEREREGADLAKHLLEEIEHLRRSRETILAGKDAILRRQREKLAQRITELEEQTKSKLDPGRLELEVAMFADRCDVSEELVRLEAHLNRFEELVTKSGGKPVGKAMDFLAQEILREINTTASKSRDLELATATLEMKSAIERAKEQILNVE